MFDFFESTDLFSIHLAESMKQNRSNRRVFSKSIRKVAFEKLKTLLFDHSQFYSELNFNQGYSSKC